VNADHGAATPSSPLDTKAPAETSRCHATPSRIWWFVIVAFAVQLTVWAAWLTFAGHHRVEEVPLATGSERR
jgi:hypothetical protein